MSMRRSAENSWCYTEVNLIKCSFMWTIDNVSYRLGEISEVLESPTFPVDNNDNIKWRLLLYPNGRTEESKNNLSLYLQLVSCDKTEIGAEFKFSILNARKEEKESLKSKQVRKFVKKNKWGFNKFICRDFLLSKAEELLPENKLTLCCEVNIAADSINTSGKYSVHQFKVTDCKLSEDFGNLFEQQTLNDVVLSVNGRELFAHKAILAARSPVFLAMFQHEMDEKKLNKVEITDIDYEVLREILHYIYTGRVNYIENMAVDLLEAADRYCLDRLKVMVEEHICSNLTINKAAEMLISANMHSADQIKARVIDFVNTHVTEIVETPGWKTMENTHYYLVSEVFKAFATLHTSPNGPPSKRIKH